MFKAVFKSLGACSFLNGGGGGVVGEAVEAGWGREREGTGGEEEREIAVGM